MAEKVTCPYCGAGMVQGNGFDAISFVCEDCGSKGPAVFQGINESDWEVWARAKKATICRADPPNRLLTLEEVTQEKAVWIEDDGCWWGDDKPHAALYIARVNGAFSMFYSDTYYRDEQETYLSNEEYGITWRCWLHKPSDEERQNTPWEESP